MSNKTFTLSSELYEYLLSVSLREPEILRALRDETAGQRLSQMQIAPEQGQFMALIARLMGARRCIEVGVYTGYSSLCIALALPADGNIIACDNSEEWTAIAKRYWQQGGVRDKIELRLAPAIETLDELLAEGKAGTFDLAFIDADKGNYWAYYQRCFELLRPGGLIAIDNTLWSGRVADAADHEHETEVIRSFNQRLYQDQRVELSLVPIGDGVTLALKTR
ncbi:MAG: class I SAM-dependent methyltransferase [Burkholderiales bacterium]|nr:class I SAM-dependent methyltransferase [Burkholderiales bacterium]